MEILEQYRLTSPQCNQCFSKQTLVKKYQNLIALLKKKADRSLASQQSFNNKSSTDDCTTSNSSFNPKNNCLLMLIILNNIEIKHKSTAFNHIKSQSFLRRCVIGKKFFQKLTFIFSKRQRRCFETLKNHFPNFDLKHKILEKTAICDSPNKSVISLKLITQQSIEVQKCQISKLTREKSDLVGISRQDNKMKIQQNSNNSLTVVANPYTSLNNYKSLPFVNQNLFNNFNTVSISKNLKKQQQTSPAFLKQSTFFQQSKLLHKNIFLLQQQNYCLLQKIKSLQNQIQQIITRQLKQNQKKTQSLQMVAQQMQQKNQLIRQLQQKLTLLQQRHYLQSNGILQDELTTLRKDVQKLQRINMRLEVQLRKRSEKLFCSETRLKDLQSQNKSINQQLIILKENIFNLEMDRMDQGLSNQRSEISRLEGREGSDQRQTKKVNFEEEILQIFEDKDKDTDLRMRLLKMQIQKEGQREKIEELKKKGMFVRNVVGNFFKSLELRQGNLKKETKGIVQLLFEVFEYSEEEKEIMFSQSNSMPKEKKFFGFI